MKSELRDLNLDAYKTLSKHLPNIDIRPQLMFIFPVLVGDTIGGNTELDKILRRLYARQIASYLELENISQIIVRNIQTIYQTTQIGSDLENQFLNRTDKQFTDELSEFLKTEHITTKLQHIGSKKSDINNETLQLIQRLSQIVETDPYLQEYVPIILPLKDKNTGAIYPVIIGTKKFQAPDNAIALILLIAQLFNLVPINNGTNFQKLKKIIKQGVINDILNLLQTGKFNQDEILKLKNKYDVDVDYAPDNNILKEIGDYLKNIFKLKKFESNSILNALKQFELVFSEGLYISLGNVISSQDIFETSEQQIAQILSHLHEIFEEQIQSLNNVLSEKLIPRVLNTIDPRIEKVIQRIQNTLLGKKFREQIYDKQNLYVTITKLNKLYLAQRYLIYTLSMLDGLLNVNKYIQTGITRALFTQNTAELLSKQIAIAIVNYFIEKFDRDFKQQNLAPLINFLRSIINSTTPNTVQNEIRFIILSNKEKFLFSIINTIDKSLYDISQKLYTSKSGKDIIEVLSRNKYLPKIDDNEITEFFTKYSDIKIVRTIGTLKSILKKSVSSGRIYGIEILSRIITDDVDCLSDMPKIYEPIYKETVFERYFNDKRFIQNICEVYNVIDMNYSELLQRMLQNSIINKKLQEVQQLSQTIANQYSAAISRILSTQVQQIFLQELQRRYPNPPQNLDPSFLNLLNQFIVYSQQIISEVIYLTVLETFLIPVYLILALILDLLLFVLYNYVQQAILTTLILLNTNDWRDISEIIKDLGNKNDLLSLKVLFEKQNINYALIIHEYSVVWTFDILSLIEFDRTYVDDINDDEYKMPAPGEWANITESNIKYIVKYFGKIMKIPIITYNDENNRIVYYLPFMKGPIKTNLETIKKFIGIKEE